jgi:hypothetical protein
MKMYTIHHQLRYILKKEGIQRFSRSSQVGNNNWTMNLGLHLLSSKGVDYLRGDAFGGLC